MTDSTTITLPNQLCEVWRGSGGFGAQARLSAIKISVRWDIQQGQLQGEIPWAT